jgi:hypothetical protein
MATVYWVLTSGRAKVAVELVELAVFSVASRLKLISLSECKVTSAFAQMRSAEIS